MSFGSQSEKPPKLKKGQYEQGKWGGGGYWTNVWDPLAEKYYERWKWVVPPKGFKIIDGNLERDTMPDPKRMFGQSPASYSAEALEKKEKV